MTQSKRLLAMLFANSCWQLVVAVAINASEIIAIVAAAVVVKQPRQR